MKPNALLMVVYAGAMLLAITPVHAQDVKNPYPSMAPLDQYLMERGPEIALARSAAPDSISKDAEVMVLGRHGYEVAAKGKNGYVCMVERGWTAPSDNAEFWNPKLRGPICFNPPAARSYLPQTIRKTEWILAGQSKARMFESLAAAIAKKELPPPEVGAMAYMMSKQQYLNDDAVHWHPHLMFFYPLKSTGAWGADLPGSPVFEGQEIQGGLTVLMIPLTKWSDGSAASMDGH